MGQSSRRIKSKGGFSCKTMTKRLSAQRDINGERLGERLSARAACKRERELWDPMCSRPKGYGNMDDK